MFDPNAYTVVFVLLFFVFFRLRERERGTGEMAEWPTNLDQARSDVLYTHYTHGRTGARSKAWTHATRRNHPWGPTWVLSLTLKEKKKIERRRKDTQGTMDNMYTLYISLLICLYRKDRRRSEIVRWTISFNRCGSTTTNAPMEFNRANLIESTENRPIRYTDQRL